MPVRFNDQNKTLKDYQTEVWVMCPNCAKKAIAKVDYELKKATLFCESCGFNKQISTEVNVLGINGNWNIAAHSFLVHNFGCYIL